jgi:hypothetical protein
LALAGDRAPIQVLNMTRSDVVAIVGGVSALSGGVAGAIAMFVAAIVLTPTEPVSNSQIAMMILENGLVFGLAGAVVGTLAAFGFVRRVPLGRLLLCTTAGTAVGLLAGWLGGPWAWHHFELLGLTGFASGAVLARAVFSSSPRNSPIPLAGAGPMNALPLGTWAELPLSTIAGGESTKSTIDSLRRTAIADRDSASRLSSRDDG